VINKAMLFRAGWLMGVFSAALSMGLFLLVLARTGRPKSQLGTAAPPNVWFMESRERVAGGAADASTGARSAGMRTGRVR
jgi:hypothetical protein